MSLIDAGNKSKTKEKPANVKKTAMPTEFSAALKKNKKAFEMFKNFGPSAQKEYPEWIIEAKTDATRVKRMETALEWIAEGKSRHWKYK